MQAKSSTIVCGCAVALLGAGLARGQCPVFPPIEAWNHSGWSVVAFKGDYLVGGLGSQAPFLASGVDGSMLVHYPSQGVYGSRSLAGLSAAFRPIVIVGARFGDAGDPIFPLAGTVRLHDAHSGEEIALLTGSQAEPWFGHSIASSGIDAGEYLIVGAPGYGLTQLDMPEASNHGAAFVYRFHWDPPQHVLVLRHIIIGEQRRERLGEAVAVLGPYPNWDDPTDPFVLGTFAVASPRADAHERNVGRVTVHSMYTGEPIFTLLGEEAFDWFGSSLAAAGDVNGDGYPDLIVGAPNHSSLADHAGRAYVFSGYDGTLLWAWDGEAENDLFGSAVAGAGDVNGDGYGDVMVGAPLHSSLMRNAGRVYIFSGADGSLLKVLDGRTADGGFGRSLSNRIGEPNRYIVGAPFQRLGSKHGAAHVLSDQPLLPGDINGDGVVDHGDLAILLPSYGIPPGEPGFNPAADVNGDGQVDQGDLALLLTNFGQACSAD